MPTARHAPALWLDRVVDTPWMTPHRADWLRNVEAWLRSEAPPHGLGELASLTSVKERPWAAVLHARFQQGCAYFKAPGPIGRHEAALLGWLQEPGPEADLAPRLLASRPGPGWMLLADGGARLSDVAAPEARLLVVASTLKRYARLQRRSVRELPRLRASGLAELPLADLPRRLGALLKDPLFRDALEASALSDIETSLHAVLPGLRKQLESMPRHPGFIALDHGDLHEGNLLVSGATPTLCDWGDACLTHPLVSLGRLLPHVVQSLPESCQAQALETLISSWSGAWDASGQPPEVLPLVLWLSHAMRALSYAKVFAAADAPQRAAWMPAACAALGTFVRTKDAYLDGALLDAMRLPL